jgi:hypothetical protein
VEPFQRFGVGRSPNGYRVDRLFVSWLNIHARFGAAGSER